MRPDIQKLRKEVQKRYINPIEVPHESKRACFTLGSLISRAPPILVALAPATIHVEMAEISNDDVLIADLHLMRVTSWLAVSYMIVQLTSGSSCSACLCR